MPVNKIIKKDSDDNLGIGYSSGHAGLKAAGDTDDIQFNTDGTVRHLVPYEIATTVLTNTNIVNLRATPVQLIAAPATGKYIEVLGGLAKYHYATAAHTESTDNIALRYTNGSGATLSTIETTGFITATADAYQSIAPAGSHVITTAAALVAHNDGDGEFGGGNASATLTITVFYRVIDAAAYLAAS